MQICSVFLATASYLIFGSWLNYNRFGARGWDLVPHGDTFQGSAVLDSGLGEEGPEFCSRGREQRRLQCSVVALGGIFWRVRVGVGYIGGKRKP